jgi:predicted nucleic acid-binding protein
MAYLLDTGVLLRAFDPSWDRHDEVLRAIDVLWSRGEQLIVTVQNLAEFWNVSTRPIESNGRGLSVDDVDRQISTIESFAVVLSESERSYKEWKRLVRTHTVIGVKVHDTRLVSVMIAHAISHLLTLNERDFRRFSEITSTTPDSLLR